VNYVIGTFAAAPLTLGAMAEFLDWQALPSTKQLYVDAGDRVDHFIVTTNLAFKAAKLPLRVDSLTTVWTVLFEQPGRYHWMFQYYLRAEGLALSWVGTGRCLFSLDFTDAQYAQVTAALLAAGGKMQADGWWDPYDGFSLPTELLQALVGLR
jgi:glutamate-1-semialdehyde 2,1-aminomutase